MSTYRGNQFEDIDGAVHEKVNRVADIIIKQSPSGEWRYDARFAGIGEYGRRKTREECEEAALQSARERGAASAELTITVSVNLGN